MALDHLQQSPDGSILVAIPSRGRDQHLPALLRMLAATRTARSTIVVVSNGPTRFAAPGLPGIHVVHIGDIPTISVAVNFAWYALRSPGSILVKMDNDLELPLDWERQIVDHVPHLDVGAMLALNETAPTPAVTVRGRLVRAPHFSDSWRIPFVWSAFLWLSARLGETLGFLDERFVRSDDGELAERAGRVPGCTLGYCHDAAIVHLAPLHVASTESAGLLASMYEACDRLIMALPPRETLQPTLWSRCVSQRLAAECVLSNGVLPADVTATARGQLRSLLDDALGGIGRGAVVERIFREL
jgi:hypothetical protein